VGQIGTPIAAIPSHLGNRPSAAFALALQLILQGDPMKSTLSWVLALAIISPLTTLVGCEDSENEQLEEQQEDVEEVRDELEETREEAREAEAELREEEQELAEDIRDETREEREAVEEAQDKL
jgi:septal ring factor EnvC (AmiA/AmiB activator)